MESKVPLLLRGFLGALSRDDSAITRSTTRQQLVQRYGAANVVDQDIDGGEGGIERGTVLFPGDPTRAMEIFWADFGRTPVLLKVSGKVSPWQTWIR